MKQHRYFALTEGRNPQEATGLMRELETDTEYFLEHLDKNGEWVLDYELATYLFGESPNAQQVDDATARRIAQKIAPAKKFHGDHDQDDHGNWADGKGARDSKIDPNASDLIEAKGATLDAVKQGFATDHPDYETHIDMITVLGSSIEQKKLVGTLGIAGEIYEKSTGEKVGNFTRAIFNSYAHHGNFEIQEKHQGKGIARGVLKNSIELYDKMGLERVELNADGEVGRYAWALYGFDWADERERESSKRQFESYVKTHLKVSERLGQLKLDKQQTADVLNRVYAIKHSWELATFTLADGYRIGKDYMLDIGPADWKASLSLDKNSPGRQIFDHYVNTEKKPMLKAAAKGEGKMADQDSEAFHRDMLDHEDEMFAFIQSKKYHGDHDQSTHGNWADGQGGEKPEGRSRFFSPLSRALGSAKQNAAPASDWAAIISKAQGVTKDELVATGILDYLKGKGSEKVTKSELEKFASEHAVKIVPVVLESRDTGTPFDQAQKRLEDAGYFVAQDRGAWVLIDREHGDLVDMHGLSPAIMSDYEFLRDRMTHSNEKPKYGQYTLPGGENYREVLLTMPTKVGDPPAPITELSPLLEVVHDSHETPDRQWFISSALSAAATPFGGKHATKEAAIAEALEIQNAARLDQWQSDNEKGLFQSSHYDEKNIVAHLRIDDRVDVDGNKVLFIEELQSDWAQAGRKEGFKGEFPDKVLSAAVAGGMSKEQAEADIKHLLVEPLDTNARPTGEQWKRLVDATQSSGIDLNEVFHSRRDHGVASAPFVTDTQAWVELGMKHALTEAVDGGYKAVAWTTGAQQTERFSLAKQVDELEYIPNINRLIAWKDGHSAFTETVAPDKLGDYIGKEAAQKLLAVPMQHGRHQLGGVQLEFGGEGMKSFYDKLVPQVAGKLIRKNDPEAKVSAIKLVFERLDKTGSWNDETDQPGFYITPLMRERIRQGLSLFEDAREFHLKGTDQDHDQSDHAPGGGGGKSSAKDAGSKAWLDAWLERMKSDTEGLVEDSPEFKRWREQNPDIQDNNLFADSPGWNEMLARVNAERKTKRIADRSQMLKEVADKMGLPEGLKLEYVDEPGPAFEVGDEKWTTGAHYDPQADTIRFFTGEFNYPEHLGAALSHEIAHARFQRTRNAWGEETRHMHEALTLEERQRLRDPDTYKLTAEGRFRYPATAVMEMLWNENHKDFREQLIREDGVSRYSISYWTHYENVRDKGTIPDPRNHAQYAAFDRAVDETLAEVNKAKHEGTWTYANKSWDQLDNLIKLVGKNTRKAPFEPA